MNIALCMIRARMRMPLQCASRAYREHMTLKRTLLRELREARASADELLQLYGMANDRRRQVEQERDLYFAQWQREQAEHGAARAEIESLRERVAASPRQLTRAAVRAATVQEARAAS